MKRYLALLLTCVFLVSMVACDSSKSSGNTTGNNTGNNTGNTTGNTTDSSTGSGNQSSSSEPMKITWFRDASNFTAISYWDDALWLQELEKKMNVDIEFMGPNSGDDYNTAVNILLASGDLPDMLFWDWNNYNGGLAGAIQDGIVVDVGANAGYRAMMPTWYGMIDSNPDFRKAVTLEDGTSALFCHVEEDLRRGAYAGHAIRKDWLDKLGLAVPTTIDELHDAFVAFKENEALLNNGAGEIWPMTDNNWGGVTTTDYLMPAWGMLKSNFFISPDNGEITYMTEYKNGEAFIDFVRTMNQWYNEGLMNPDFLTQDNSAKEAKVTSNTVGFCFMFPGWFQQYTEGVEIFDPSLAGTVNWYGMVPVVGLGGKAYTPNEALTRWAAPNEGTCVLSTAENSGKMETILKLIDYLYTDEGSDLINWGVEGVSYTVNAEGKREWTEVVTNDPTFTFGDNIMRFALPTRGGWPKKMSYEAWASLELTSEQARVAHDNFWKADTSLIPPLLLLGKEDAEEVNRIRTNVDTAIGEYYVNAIYGITPVDDGYKLLETIDGMGIDRAIEIVQQAYVNYQNK